MKIEITNNSNIHGDNFIVKHNYFAYNIIDTPPDCAVSRLEILSAVSTALKECGNNQIEGGVKADVVFFELHRAWNSITDTLNKEILKELNNNRTIKFKTCNFIVQINP